MEGHKRFTKIGGKFGVGVIGLGEGKGMVKGLQGHPELKVYGVCDTNVELVEDIKREFQVPHGFTEYEEMLKVEEINIICIYTPDQLHVVHIEKALRAGKHVICTKPLVNNAAEAKKIFKLSEEYPQCKIMVGQSSRFFGPMRKQRAEYESGKLGELCFVETHYIHDMRWFYNNRPWTKDGGFDLLFSAASHPVDLIRWYMGDVEEVSAYASKTMIAEKEGFKGNDTFIINYKFKNGKIGRTLAFYGLEQPHQTIPWIQIGLYGTSGTFISKYPQLEAVVKYEGESERVESYFEDIYHYFQFEGINHHAGEFLNYIEYFAKCIVDNVTAQPDIYDGFKTMATLEAIRESINTGRPIKADCFMKI